MPGYDYVVIGGGSAGCTLAARISGDPAASVCVLETGDANKELLVWMPAWSATSSRTRASTIEVSGASPSGI